ncbi:MAG: DNA polymerase III subunit alpha [Hyphomicrobiales bacterium]
MARDSLQFIHLRVHSAYSLLEGALPIKQIANLCHEFAMPAVAITDTNNMFGALEFSETMSREGIQPIVGCTLPVRFDESADISANGMETLNLPLLVKDELGAQNLMKLSSRAHLEPSENEPPHISLEQLRGHSEGLICLSGGPGGPLNQALVNGQSALAEERARLLFEVFGDRLYVELQRHEMAEEIETESDLVKLAYKLELPLVATNEPFFPRSGDFASHDALICIADGAVVASDDRRQLTAEHFFKSQKDMAALFADLPEAVENTVEIARRCAYRLRPRSPILPKFAAGLDEAAELRRIATEGLEKRLEMHGTAPEHERQEYFDKLEYELDVIIQMDFPGYFLIVADFIQWAKNQDIPVGPGRGSGAGSVVAWSLTITDLDPLRFNLIFERFLNPERVSMPDFDIDFCQDRRDEVIAYVQAKYGVDQVAQIITFGKLQARAVCRDVGRVLQMPYGQVDGLCKLIPNNPANPVTLQEAIDGEPRLAEERRNDDQVKRLLDYGLKLEGLYRHASTHAAGVVIGDRPLEELVPMYRDPRSPMPVTQFNMKWVEQAGLVKFDFLGLKTLTVLQTAVKLLADRGVEVDLSNLPLDDEKTYELLCRGETVSVFQLESSGMKDLIRRARPGNIEDIIALVALYRPGPMENIPKYIASKHGEEQPEFLHEKLTPILEDTYGIIIYQEQVLQIAQVLASYSLGEADLLRRAMGKKIKSEMDEQMARFVSGAVKNGVEEAQAKFIFELVAKFAGYGFNRAHSAAYGFIAYQTAFLKANYPVEFMAASMTLDAGNTDKLLIFKREADRMGVTVNPPSINKSGADFIVENGEIHYSLAALKNVGRGAIEDIVNAREKDGPFTSLGDFARRINPRIINKRMVENLARAGTFDAFNANRRQVVAGVEAILALAGRMADDREVGQNSLFGGSGGDGEDVILPTGVEPWLPMENLAEEFDAVGFYISGHPLDEYMDALTRIGVDSWASFSHKALNKGANGGKLTGTVTYRQERRSKNGNKFAFVGISDPTGQFEAVVFGDVLANVRDFLEPGTGVIIKVEADVEGEEVRLRLQSVQLLEKAAESIASGLKIYVKQEPPLDSIASRLKNGGKAPVSLILQLPNAREVEIALGAKFTVTPQIKAAMKAIPGVLHVEDM